MPRKEYFPSYRRNPRRERQVAEIAKRINASDEFASVIDHALASAIDTETDQGCWWHWAIRSDAGIRAIYDAGVRVNIDRPWRGLVDDDHRGHWRAQPWCDPGENSHSWPDAVAALRQEIGEDAAGIFFVEHVKYHHSGVHPTDHMTLIAISQDGKRSAWKQVYAHKENDDSNH